MTDMRFLEQRTDRPYDEQSASTVHVWRGNTLTRACTFDRALAGALAIAALETR